MVVGLGNPGPRYRDTRHNAGFWFLDRWAGILGLSFRKPWFRPFSFAEHDWNGNRLVLVKPLTFMNRSGEALEAVFARFGVGSEDMVVVFDQMDLPPGRLRMKPHGSHAGHNGLKSVDAFLGHSRYHRIAVGIGRPDPERGVVDHVLGVPPSSDRAAVEAALARVVEPANELWPRGWEPLIHAVNRRDADAS